MPSLPFTQTRVKRFLQLLPIGLLATTGCLSMHLVNDKARSHQVYDHEKRQDQAVEGQPAYYALLPFTITGDIATSPIQLIWFICSDKSSTLSVDGVPVPLPGDFTGNNNKD